MAGAVLAVWRFGGLIFGRLVLAFARLRLLTRLFVLLLTLLLTLRLFFALALRLLARLWTTRFV